METTAQTPERPCSFNIKSSAKGAYSVDAKAYGETLEEAKNSALKQLASAEEFIKTGIAQGNLAGSFYGA